MSIMTDTGETSHRTGNGRRRSGWQLFITRGLRALLVTLLALPVVGFSYEMIAGAVEPGRFPPPGRLVSVDGRQMHLNCTGAGSPTVVMDAGLGGWSLDWSLVQPDLVRLTRVCSYDRAGLGWSEASTEPHDAQHAVGDLYALLAGSGEPGPFVLVGHSNGGLRTLLYAHTYPQEVAGLVLVDPTPLATDAEMLAFLSPAEQAEYLALLQAMAPELKRGDLDPFAILQTLRPFGVPRLLTETLLQGSQYHFLGAADQPVFRFGMNQPARLATNTAETEQRQASIDQVRAIPSLGRLPLAVLTSTKMTTFHRDPLPANLPPRLVELIQKTVWGAEAALSRLSANSTIARVERSGHYIQFDRPDAVIDTVQTMVGLLRER